MLLTSIISQLYIYIFPLYPPWGIPQQPSLKPQDVFTDTNVSSRSASKSPWDFRGLGPTLHWYHVLAKVRGQDPQGAHGFHGEKCQWVKNPTNCWMFRVFFFFFRPKNWVFGWILGGFLFLSNKCQGELDWTWAFHQRTTGSIYLCIYIYTHRN